MNPVDVSILVCTRNRCDHLRPTLAAVAACSVPPGWTVELVVIDNGSTDQTAAVVAAAGVGNLSSVRYVCEPRPGQVHARNRGLAESTGAVILFTDDDTVPPTDWITGMAEPIRSGAADAVVGGVHFPADYLAAMDTEPARTKRSWFAATDPINPVRPQRMVGANMAFSRKVLEKVPGFDPELGPGALGFYDETVFSYQLLEAGFSLVPRLELSVEHRFDLSRLSRPAMLDTARRMGLSHGYVLWHWCHEPVPPRARWLATVLRLKLLGRRLQRWVGPGRADYSVYELDRIWWISSLEQHRRESARPRRYPPPDPATPPRRIS